MHPDSINSSRDSAYQKVCKFVSKDRPGTLMLLYLNGYGKSTIEVRAFMEMEKTCLLSQSHRHIQEVLIPKIEHIGLVEGQDFVYYRPMEMICSTYKEVKKDIVLYGKNKALRELFMPARKRHEIVVKCTDTECAYTLQEFSVSKNNPDRITKVVSTVRMFVRKELQYNADVIFIDELDGTMDPQPVRCSKALYSTIKEYIGGSITDTSSELNLPILNIFGRKILDRQKILSDIEKKRKTMQEEVIAGNMEAYNEREVADMNLLWQIAKDGFLMTDQTGSNEDWYFNGYLHRVPLLYEIVDALTDQIKYHKKKIIVSMARMRKNPILKRKFQILFDMLLRITREPGIDTVAYKAYKAWDFRPIFQGEDCDFPDDEWTIIVRRPTIRANITHINELFSAKDLKTDSFMEFLEIDSQIASITTKFHKKRGLVITFKALKEWIEKARNLSPSELNGKLKYLEEPAQKKILKAIQSTKWDYLRISDFGNNSAGTDMRENEKFLIVYGNWFSGEHNRFQSLLYPDRNNNYRLTVVPNRSDIIKEELQILLMREYMEYPMRSRRRVPTYCITNYFNESDETLEPVNIEIFKDFNVKIVYE